MKCETPKSCSARGCVIESLLWKELEYMRTYGPKYREMYGENPRILTLMAAACVNDYRLILAINTAVNEIYPDTL